MFFLIILGDLPSGSSVFSFVVNAFPRCWPVPSSIPA